MGKSPERGTGSVGRPGVEPAPLHDKEVLGAVFDHIPVMISFYGPARDLLHVNREWERTLGWNLEEARTIDILAAPYGRWPGARPT
jgi:PAS domain-containing protein